MFIMAHPHGSMQLYEHIFDICFMTLYLPYGYYQNKKMYRNTNEAGKLNILYLYIAREVSTKLI